MQFRAADKRRITEGRLTRSYRNWKRRQVRAGGRYPIAPLGFIRVKSVQQVPLTDLSDADAHAAGHESLHALHEMLRSATGLPDVVWAVEFEFDGNDNPDAPVTVANDVIQVRDACQHIDAMEQRSSSGPWAWATLALIAANPECRAADLAAQLGLGRDDFKARVRRLRKRGLTHSLETGYRVSGLGAACLATRRG